MQKLSTGADATLGEYRKLANAVFGSESPAVAFLDRKIQESPNGENEEVIQEEGQMVHALMTIHSQNAKVRDAAKGARFGGTASRRSSPSSG